MSKRAMIVPVVTLVVAAALLFTIKGCWNSWEGGAAEQRTDDAYLRADLTPLSTRVSGTVRKLEVGDYEAVKPGQLLVQLDDDDYAAVLAEAKAGLAAAEANLADNQAAKRIQDVKVQNAETGITSSHRGAQCGESRYRRGGTGCRTAPRPNANARRRCSPRRRPPIRNWKRRSPMRIATKACWPANRQASRVLKRSWPAAVLC